MAIIFAIYSKSRLETYHSNSKLLGSHWKRILVCCNYRWSGLGFIKPVMVAENFDNE